jgi:hypothetical protein
MATLREQVEKQIVESNGDSKAAAIAICKLMNRHLDMEGNGWFDNDAVMLAALQGS